MHVMAMTGSCSCKPLLANSPEIPGIQYTFCNAFQPVILTVVVAIGEGV